MDGLWLALAAGAVLVALWLGATRRHLRRQARHAEWDTGGLRPDLWTSSARCTSCGRPGGVMSERDGRLWYDCLACGHRHERRSRA